MKKNFKYKDLEAAEEAGDQDLIKEITKQVLDSLNAPCLSRPSPNDPRTFALDYKGLP